MNMAALGELYELVSASGDVLFWWVGEESNWANVFCAFEGEQMVAKGQLQVFNVVPPGRAAGSKHKIFVNLKLRPGREKDTELRDSVYARLLERAHVLKSTLPPEYGTILCTGNYAAEESCHAYFAEHLGYRPDSCLYTLHRDLHEPIHTPELESLPDSGRDVRRSVITWSWNKQRSLSKKTQRTNPETRRCAV